MNRPSISCIIPVYNEGVRVIPVLEAITQIENISQIICVDDGSFDNTAEIIETNWPQINLHRLPENMGKTAAIRHGAAYLKNEIVLLMDADLQYITKTEIHAAITAIHENSKIDMIILRRMNAPWFVKMDRGDILFSGERILWKNDLKAILDTQINGYQLEIAINLYMLENNKKVFWIPSSAYNTFKMKKLGPMQGFIEEMKMFTDIVSYVGIKNYVHQITSFALDELSENEK